MRFTTPEKRIAYAASIGCRKIPAFNEKRFKKYVSEYKAVSVREDSANEMISSKMNVNSCLTLDPVLLVGVDFWKKYLTDKKEIGVLSDKYILCYFLDDINEEYAKVILEYADINNYEIYLVDSGGGNILEQSAQVLTCDPFEFLSLVFSANVIFTDSFHGTALSILFNRNFRVFPRNYKGNKEQSERIYSILRMTRLQDCFLHEPIIAETEMDYDYANQRLEEEREKSRQFLRLSIDGM